MSQEAVKAAIYARVSTVNHGQNPEVQLAELRRLCRARGWTIAHEIVDHGYSGGSSSRPGLRRLEALARSREIDVVAVVRLDRLFRSTRHLLTTIAEFTDVGVTFVSLKESIDLTTSAGKLLLGILAALAEFERDLLRERTAAGLAFARAQGKTLGRPRTVDAEEIRRLRASGASYAQIQTALGVSKGAVGRALTSAPKTSSKQPPKTSVDPGGGHG